MRSFVASAIILFAFAFASAQNEQSPIVEKEISYKNWTFKDIRTDKDVNLRDFAKGKKLTMIIYFAPWCHNFQHDAPMVEKLYEKYQGNGLNVIGVGEYGSVSDMKSIFDTLKITFPAVYESDNRDKRQYTTHFSYRQVTGDSRSWGSPWYIFLTPSVMEKKGDVITKKTFVINGEMIETEGEQFIRKNLGLGPLENKKSMLSTSNAGKGKIEVCEDYKKPAELAVAPDKRK